MAQFELVIRHGTVVTAADRTECDIGVRNGRIVALADHLDDAERIIDAGGKLVLPGGIDSHVHVDEPPFHGVASSGDFGTDTIAAACGGTTTIVPFVQQERGRSLRSSVREYHAKAEGRAVIDYAFHIILIDPNSRLLGQEVPALIEDGYTSYKVYMTYDGMALNDTEILSTLEAAKAHGAMVMIHAENDHCIHHLAARMEATGATSLENYPLMAPQAVEREATHRAITLGEIVGVPVLLVHVSAAQAMEQIRWAQERGLMVYGETCPQYLFLTGDHIARSGWEGAKYLCAPPPRDTENQKELGRGIAGCVFQVLSSDHCSFKFEGTTGKKANGPTPHFRHVPPGVPGIEARLPLVFSEGVGKGRIDINTFVAITATNAARIYGLYPRKGTIAVGSDADITIWDPEKRVTISADMLHENLDYTPYEGFEVEGWPVKVISRGEVIVDEGEVLAEHGRGGFLACDRPDLNPAVGNPS
ncbi:MAG: dihydropyrimidinase [Alphaproteobacteria bacterium]|nr:dihydropyrimidinase [Alphaproteobacteria bacterium]